MKQTDISAFFTVKNSIKKFKKTISKKPDIIIYTDGSCINNGKPNAKAGWGIYISENSDKNNYGIVEGKQSNNTGELNAIIKAYYALEEEINNNISIAIYSDSLYAIRCCTTYGEKLEKRCWIKKKPIPNVDLVKKAFYLFKNKKNVKFVHIKAHTGKQDIHSIGNDKADELANKAIGITSCPYQRYKN